MIQCHEGRDERSRAVVEAHWGMSDPEIIGAEGKGVYHTRLPG